MTKYEVVYTPEVLALMQKPGNMANANDLSPIVKIHPARIIALAKEGKWPKEICNYIISGNRVKFFKMQFLRNGGWIR